LRCSAKTMPSSGREAGKRSVGKSGDTRAGQETTRTEIREVRRGGGAEAVRAPRCCLLHAWACTFAPEQKRSERHEHAREQRVPQVHGGEVGGSAAACGAGRAVACRGAAAGARSRGVAEEQRGAGAGAHARRREERAGEVR
jgi:hypothetical protein